MRITSNDSLGRTFYLIVVLIIWYFVLSKPVAMECQFPSLSIFCLSLLLITAIFTGFILYFGVFNYSLWVYPDKIILKSWLHDNEFDIDTKIKFDSIGIIFAAYGIFLVRVNGKIFHVIYTKKRGIKYLINWRKLITEGLELDYYNAVLPHISPDIGQNQVVHYSCSEPNFKIIYLKQPWLDGMSEKICGATLDSGSDL